MVERTYEMPALANEQLDLIELLSTNAKMPGEINQAYALVDNMKYRVDIYPEDRHMLKAAGYDLTPGACHIPIITAADGRRIADILDANGELWPVNRRERARYGTQGNLATNPAQAANVTPFRQVEPDAEPGQGGPNGTGKSALYAKMARVMGKLQRIPKSGFNKHFGYPFVTEADIADAVRIALSEVGIAFFTEIEEWTRTDGVRTKTYNNRTEEKPYVMTRVKMRFTFACADTGQTIERHWWGEAEDDSDKGISKAVTLAQKYFLKTTFVISTGDPTEDPDSGLTESEPQGKSGLTKRQTPTPPATPQPPAQKPAQSEPATSANDAPGDVLSKLMNDSNIKAARSSVPEARNTINKMWREGELKNGMDEADMVLSVVERLSAHRKDGGS